jgi:hypothetical protein
MKETTAPAMAPWFESLMMYLLIKLKEESLDII